MRVQTWGPPGWKFLHTITFNYPEKIDEADPEDRAKKFFHKQLFENLQHTLPCVYCRQSYKQFLLDDPIEPNLGTRKDFTYWFYRIHNKVNAKLRKQELDLFKTRLAELHKKPLQGGELFRKKQELAQEVFFTPPDPPYEEVCKHYNVQRASCSRSANKIASCRL